MFYQLLEHPGLLSRSAFGRRVTGDEAVSMNGVSNVDYRMCLNVIAMGGLNSVDIAQTVHESILSGHGCLDPDKTLRYGNELPTSNVFEGVYIDDRLVLAILPEAKLSQPSGFDKDLIERGHAAYHQWKLPRSL